MSQNEKKLRGKGDLCWVFDPQKGPIPVIFLEYRQPDPSVPSKTFTNICYAMKNDGTISELFSASLKDSFDSFDEKYKGLAQDMRWEYERFNKKEKQQ